MSFRQFLIVATIIAILFVMGPVVAAQLANGGMGWIVTFFSNLGK